MNKVKVALIDTGIDRNCKYLKSIKWKGTGIAYDKRAVINGNYLDDNGHGTACASVILRECKDVEFLIIKAMNHQGVSNALIIEHALKILKNQEVDVINMSFAIADIEECMIKRRCDQLTGMNRILVASDFNNHEKKAFPASYDGVYSVRSGKIEIGKVYEFNKEKQQYVVNDTPIMCADLDNKYQMIQANNSLATARLTGIICFLIKKYNLKPYEYSCMGEILKCEEGYIREKTVIYEEQSMWSANNEDELLNKLYNVLDSKINLYKPTEQICDFEVLTTKGPLRFNEVYDLLNYLEIEMNVRFDYMQISRFDLVTLGTIKKLIEKCEGGNA